MTSKKSVAIIGTGRFGKTLYRLLRGHFRIIVWDINPLIRRGLKLKNGDIIALHEKDVFVCDTIFYAVPIRKFETTLRSHLPHLKPSHLLIDVLSVKLHPAWVFRTLLKKQWPRVILTHPMFGPDSSRAGFKGLRIVMNKFTSTPAEFNFWCKFFRDQGLQIIQLSPEAHDRLAAVSQGVAHFSGQLLKAIKFKPTKIDTLGTIKLHEFVNLVCGDTEELFLDLNRYNPYMKNVLKRLLKAHKSLIANINHYRVQ